MADEVFRQRKPINRDEIQKQNAPADEMAQQEEFDSAPVAQNPAPQGPRPDPSFSIGGNVPQEFMRRINASQSAAVDEDFVVRESRMKRATNARNEAPTQMRATGSNKLESLIEGMKEVTNVYEKIQLPSLGKFYNGDDGPADGVLHIRPMTGAEEEILATPRFVKRGNAINMIFNRCIKEQQYNSENFLSADRTFLLIWLRGISYTPNYDVEVTCPFTDKKFNYTINLDLDVDTCPADYGLANLTGTLPETGYNFRYRLATGGDEQRVQDHRDKHSKSDRSGMADDTLLYRTALLLEEVEGLTHKDELLILLQKMPISDVSYLRNLTSEPPFGVNTKISITSPFTMEDFEIDLPLESNFFFPRQKKVATRA
jgi:hypothetical protein